MGQLCSGGSSSGSTVGKTSKGSLRNGDQKGNLAMERRASIKGPMTKYMLKFDKVQEVYSLTFKEFTSHAGNDNSKSKFHNKVPIDSIPTILDSLGVPKFNNLDELISQYFKTAGKQNIEFKGFLVGVGNLVWKQGVQRISVTAQNVDYGAKLKINNVVEEITPGSAADKAGITVGDKVVTINAHAVKNNSSYKISLENALNAQSIDKSTEALIVFQRDLAASLGVESSNQEVWNDLKAGFATVEAMFEDIDTDKGGTIDYEEFCSAFNQCSGTLETERVQTRLQELDFDGNNEIDRDEFIFGISAWVGFADDEDLDEDRDA